MYIYINIDIDLSYRCRVVGFTSLGFNDFRAEGFSKQGRP